MARRSKQEIAAEKALISRIYDAIDNDPRAVAKAIYLVGRDQTEAEKESHAALNDNGVGWSRCDANFGQFMFKVVSEKGYVPNSLLDKARSLIRKYAKTQLLRRAKEREHHFAVKTDD